jgi:hypothetical protein
MSDTCVDLPFLSRPSNIGAGVFALMTDRSFAASLQVVAV